MKLSRQYFLQRPHSALAGSRRALDVHDDRFLLPRQRPETFARKRFLNKWHDGVANHFAAVIITDQCDGKFRQQGVVAEKPAAPIHDPRCDSVQRVEAGLIQPVVRRFRFFQPIGNNPPVMLCGSLYRLGWFFWGLARGE